MTVRSFIMNEDPDELRYILRKHKLGVNLTEANVRKYMMSHRYLTVEEMARRMHDTGLFLDIFDDGIETNSIETWEKDLRKRIQSLDSSSEIQIGPYFIRRDEKFKGGFRVFADLGTILDSSLRVAQLGDHR